MFNKSIAIVLLTAATAHAADGDTVDMTGDTTATAAPVPVAVPGVNSSGAPFTKGMLGLAFPVVLVPNLTSIVALTGENVPTVDLLYFLDESSAVDFLVGLNVHRYVQYNNATPPMGETVTRIGFAGGVGYRMYKHRNKVATYLEPQIVMDWPSTSDSATFTLKALGLFGVEAMLAEWCSLSGAIGAGITIGNKFDDLQLATTALLAANLYWK